MEQLTPAAIAFAPCLGAARDDDRRGDGSVVRALARGHVRVAPVHVEDLYEGVGVGFTPGTVQPREDGGVGAKVAH